MLARPLDLPLPLLMAALGGGLMFLPAVHAVLIDQHAVARPFFYGGLIVLMMAGMVALALSGRPLPHDTSDVWLRGYVLSYLLVPPVLAWPFVEALADTSLANGWFEMLSCFTVTGATLYPDPGRLPASLHLWRGLVGWLGGFYILVMAMAILAPRNLGGAEVLSGAVGRATGEGAALGRLLGPGPRVQREAALLFPVYGALTLVLWLLLVTAGEAALPALLRAMATLSTSGIVVPQGISSAPAGLVVSGAPGGILAEGMVALALVLALTRRSLPAAGRSGLSGPRVLAQDIELRLGLAVVLAAAALLWLRYLAVRLEMAQALDVVEGLRAAWAAVFAALSVLTTTGFVPHDWSILVPGGRSGLSEVAMLLMGLAILGGGVATTAGGVKLLRLAALLRHSGGETQRALHPHVVTGGRLRMGRASAWVAWVSFVLFALTILAGLLILTAEGMDFESALTFSVAALTGTGPLADLLLPPGQSWSILSAAGKATLAGMMVVGRVEVLALLVVLNPETWRR